MSKNLANVTPEVGLLRITAHILDPYRTLRSFRKWDQGMVINPEDETFCSTGFQEAFLNNVENEYYANMDTCPSINSKTY
jgi:hypothetical protein